tara:strand:- start:1638 stop:2837 length:1200 start_codon:yes stop_codon:yes gene_type:complete
MITINPTKLVRNVSKNGEFIFRGGLALQAELGAQNVKRFSKFITTPRGTRFLAQQALLQKVNPNRKKITNIDGTKVEEQPYQTTRDYNPLAPLLAKAISQEGTSLKPTRHSDGENIFGSLNPFANKPKANGTGPVTFFSKDKKVDLQVRYGGEINVLDSFPNRQNESGQAEVKDFIKFRIRDAVNGNYIIFPALLSGAITDNSTTTPTESSYIGRADKVYVYGSYSRTISFTVNIVALDKLDIPIIWEKVNAAKGLVLPEYKEFEDIGVGKRPVAPIVNLTLGDLFNDAPGFFTSVNMSIPEGSTWSLTDGTQVPHLCSLAFEFTYIGKENPSMRSMHYDNIQKEFPKVVDERRRQEQEDLDNMTFSEAFKKKRGELGPGKTFTWKGNSYSTNTAEDNG